MESIKTKAEPNGKKVMWRGCEVYLIADCGDSLAHGRCEPCGCLVGKTDGAIIKPPLGLKPKRIHDKNRALEILEAMTRYIEDGSDIPKEWVEELKELV